MVSPTFQRQWFARQVQQAQRQLQLAQMRLRRPQAVPRRQQRRVPLRVPRVPRQQRMLDLIIMLRVSVPVFLVDWPQ